MSNAQIRPITNQDLEAIIALDHAITGQWRRGFYEKRLAAVNRDPNAFVGRVATIDGKVVGLVSAHVLDGEFGGTTRVAVIDALGVKPDARGKGVARALMQALDAPFKSRQVVEIHTQADWDAHELVQFFAASGFGLSPSLVLESVPTRDL